MSEDLEQVVGWETETKPASETTLKGLNELCKTLLQLRDNKEACAEALKVANEAVDEIETKILNVLVENNMPNFKSEHGTFSVKTSKTFAQPESLERKLELFEYLKTQGIFENMVAVNARTLSSWAAKEVESKEKQGVFGWVPPGLSNPNEYKSLSVRKK